MEIDLGKAVDSYKVKVNIDYRTFTMYDDDILFSHLVRIRYDSYNPSISYIYDV